MSELDDEQSQQSNDLSTVLVSLFKGPIYRDSQEKLWKNLTRLRSQVSDYVSLIGVNLFVDEAEGYAFLQSTPRQDGDNEIPRLVARHTLSFHVSILLALLRKRLAEFDATSSETRLVLSRDQIVEMMRLFMPESTNEVRLLDNIDSYINKVVDLGFLRRMGADSSLLEVRRILKAYVDGQWLSEFDKKLSEYQELLNGSSNDSQTRSDSEVK